MTTLLSARDLAVGHGRAEVVRGVDIAVQPGEVIALLGPNGAGKTSTLMTMAGFLPPLAGQVSWLGNTDPTPVHRRIREGMRYVPEGRSVIRSLSTLDNLRLGPGPVDDALKIFPELEPLLARRAGLLSGGEQQMVALARALAGNPMVLLVDELSLGLAPLMVRRLLMAISAAAKNGVGALIVEQHLPMALEMATRCLVIGGGSVALEGSVAELRNRAGDIEDAYFMGSGRPSTRASRSPHP